MVGAVYIHRSRDLYRVIDRLVHSLETSINV
jgi:hypothetical protein